MTMKRCYVMTAIVVACGVLACGRDRSDDDDDSAGDGDADSDADTDSDGDSDVDPPEVVCTGGECCWPDCVAREDHCGPNTVEPCGTGRPDWFDEMECVVDDLLGDEVGMDLFVACPCRSEDGTLMGTATGYVYAEGCDFTDAQPPSCADVSFEGCTGGEGEGEGEGEPDDVLRATVTGIWAGGANCDGNELEFGWFLCPAGRVRGFSRINQFEFLDCGTWSVNAGTVTLDLDSTSVVDGSTAPLTVVAEYDGERLLAGGCPVPLERVPDAIDDSECTGGTCSAGGTGAAQCGADFDCGRCWYCENEECRYGGEGPFGCFRGWEP